MARLRPSSRVLAASVAGALAFAGPASASAAAPREQVQVQPRQSQRQALPDDDDDDDDAAEDAGAERPVAGAPVAGARPAGAQQGAAAPAEERVIEVELGPGEIAWIEVDGQLVEVRGPEAPAAGPRAPAAGPRAPAAGPRAPAAGPRAPAAAQVPSVAQRPVGQDRPVRRVTVRIAGPAGAVIEARDGDGWRRVCVAPCRAEVAAGTALRATAPADRGPLWDMPTSRPYAVPEGAGAAIDLTVRPGSRQQRAGGAGLAILSGAGVAIGLAMLRASGSLEPPSRRSYEGAIVVGMASLTLITGVAMVVSGRTRITPAKAGRVALAPGGLAF